MNKPMDMNDVLEGRVKAILSRPYARRLTPEPGGGFSASILEFPGCFAEGDTADEALARLHDASESWLLAYLAGGGQVREPITLDGASGRIALRIPRSLHHQVMDLAELEACSVNQLLTTAIAEYVGRACSRTPEAKASTLPARAAQAGESPR